VTVHTPAKDPPVDGARRAALEALRLDGVTRRFGAATALDALDLEIAGGEFIALLGPSGCGNSA
jgi:putative spermidine/putrescine transport system ATP-binding protein